MATQRKGNGVLSAVHHPAAPRPTAQHPAAHRPKVRADLEFATTLVEGVPMVVVTDPWELQASSLLLSQGAYALLQLLDGTRSLAELQAEVSQLAGRHLPMGELERLLVQFDELLLLESEQFQSLSQRLIGGYLEAAIRLPMHEGVSYPEDATKLRSWLDEVLAMGEGSCGVAPEDIFAVVAPHLDLRVELESYALAYRGLRGLEPDRIVLLGTGHEIRDGLYSLTTKSFQTPLGTMPCDVEAIERLRLAGNGLCEPHDLAHRKEHALEFQLPFLQRVLARPDIPIVPILCGSLYHWLPRARRLMDIPGIAGFVEALREIVTERTLVILGVDFAHVGLKFGHAQDALSMYPATHHHDKQLLESLCRGDALGFWRKNQAVENHYNVCGFSSMSLLLEAFPGLRGEVLRHDTWFEDETQSAVSFASVYLTRS